LNSRSHACLGRCSTTSATLPAMFCIGFFRDRVSRTICLGWPQSMIFLISASQVARITGMSHWRLLQYDFKVILRTILT
jgi:hypothetical protein